MLPSRPVPSTISPADNSYRPVLSRKSLQLHFTVGSRRGNIPLPSRPVNKTCPYRPVSSTKPTPTVPSRRQNLSCSPVPPSKPVPTVKSRGQNLSLPSRPAIHCRHSFPSRCRHRLDAVHTIITTSIYSTNTENVLHLPVERYQAV